MHSLLTRLFGKPEEINGGERCPTYLYRWFILRSRWWKCYIHHFVGADWSRDLHDHPRKFVSIGLWGTYLETTAAGTRVWAAPWFRSFPAEHAHRIEVLAPGGSCWTLVFVFKITREWGFWNSGRWIYWRDYVWGDSKHLADAARTCGDSESFGSASEVPHA